MKKIFVFLIAIVASLSCNVNKCEIVGDVTNFVAEEGYLYLVDMWDSRSVIDSVLLDGEHFHFKSVKHEPTFAHLIMANGRPLSHLFVEKGKVEISGDYSVGEVRVKGTPANEALESMLDESQIYMADYRSAASLGNKAKMSEIEDSYDFMRKGYMDQNMSNPFGVFMVQQFSYSEPSVVTLANIEKLSSNMQKLAVVKKIKESAERKFKTEPQVEGSDYVPYYVNIEQPNVNGENVSLKSVVESEKNRYVLLDFWASWCGPCMGEMPHLKEAYKLYHDKGFEIYGVSLDAKHEAWSGAIEKQQMGWVNVSTLERFDNPAVADYAVESIPTNFLIDCSNGVIIAKNLRGDEVLEKLAELFK